MAMEWYYQFSEGTSYIISIWPFDKVGSLLIKVTIFSLQVIISWMCAQPHCWSLGIIWGHFASPSIWNRIDILDKDFLLYSFKGQNLMGILSFRMILNFNTCVYVFAWAHVYTVKRVHMRVIRFFVGYYI